MKWEGVEDIRLDCTERCGAERSSAARIAPGVGRDQKVYVTLATVRLGEPIKQNCSQSRRCGRAYRNVAPLGVVPGVTLDFGKLYSAYKVL